VGYPAAGLLFFLFGFTAVFAVVPASASDYSLSAGGGIDFPAGGLWGDTGAGFKPSPAVKVSVEKTLDKLLSYGLDSSLSMSHENRKLPDLKIKIFSLVPYLKAFYSRNGRSYYGFTGVGLYQWAQTSFRSAGVSRSSASGTSPGLLLGGGVSYPFWRGSTASFEARWNHVFNMRGGNFSLDSADNLGFMFVVGSRL